MFSIRSLPVIAAVTVLVTACHEIHFEPRSASGEIDIYDHLFAVSVPSEDHVVAAGYWGAIYLSQDGGDTWEKAETDTKHLLYDVSMANEEKGWAAGQLGLILRTEDGGRSWAHQPTVKEEQGVHLFSVQALDESRAWAVGTWGTRLFTDDGGKSWQDHSLTVDETHPQFVWLSVADQDRVRRGERVFEDVGLNDIYCLPANTQHCWMIGEFGYLFRSEDGGAHWERGQIIGGILLDPIQLGYNEIEIGEEDKEKIREFARMKTIPSRSSTSSRRAPRRWWLRSKGWASSRTGSAVGERRLGTTRTFSRTIRSSCVAISTAGSPIDLRWRSPSPRTRTSSRCGSPTRTTVSSPDWVG
jgi:hypothetical protein